MNAHDVDSNVHRPTTAEAATHPVTDDRRERRVRRLELPSNTTLRIRAFAILAVLDCLAILIGFGAAAAVRGDPASDTRWLLFGSALMAMHLFVSVSIRAFSAAVLEEPFFAIKKGEQALLAAICAVTLMVFYLKSGETFPRLTIALGSIGAIVLVGVARYFYVRHLPAIVRGNPFRSILIRDAGQPIPSGDFSLVVAAQSYFDPESDDPIMYDRLAKSLATVDRVVIAAAPERRQAWARALRGANVQGEIVIPELASLAPLGLGPSGDIPSVIVATGPLSLYQRASKRIFDLVFASLVIILLTPLLVAVAILIKLDSPGPVLFRQMRIGRGNKMFELIKFRSMRADRLDHAADRLVVRDDDRVTRIGRFMRRTSIDELPQLIHVVMGDMSIVGPRPHALGARAASKLYWEVDDRYRARHATKPGLTGLAQVRGFRGNTLKEDDLRNRLEADLEYLNNWSIWRDLKIIVMTVRVLFHENAF